MAPPRVPTANLLFKHLPKFDTLKAPFDVKDSVERWFYGDSKKNIRELLVGCCQYIGRSDFKELDQHIDGNRLSKEEAEKIESFLSMEMIGAKEPLLQFYQHLLGKMQRIQKGFLGWFFGS